MLFLYIFFWLFQNVSLLANYQTETKRKHAILGLVNGNKTET